MPRLVQGDSDPINNIWRAQNVVNAGVTSGPYSHDLSDLCTCLLMSPCTPQTDAGWADHKG